MASSAASSAFHLAFTVQDLEKTRAFFGGLLGCQEGYVSDTRVDFNFFGNHLVAHLRRGAPSEGGAIQTDEQRIPLPHFGVILDMPSWQALADRLRSRGAKFLLEPRTRGKGAHEQSIMFLTDPSGNTFEFKGLKDPTPAQLLARSSVGAP